MPLPGMPVALGRKNGIIIPGSVIERTDDQSTYTLNDIPVPGPESAGRGFALLFCGQVASDVDVTGVTIGGVAATFLDRAKGGTSAIAGVAWSPRPTGADVNAVVSISGGGLIRLAALPIATYNYMPDTSYTDEEVQNLAVAAAVSGGGAVLAAAFSNIVSGSLTMGGLADTVGSNAFENANNQYAFGHEGPIGAQLKNITATGSGTSAGTPPRSALFALTFKPG